MRRACLLVTLILALTVTVYAVWAAENPHQHAAPPQSSPKGAQLLPGMGSHVHPIATKNPQAGFRGRGWNHRMMVFYTLAGGPATYF